MGLPTATKKMIKNRFPAAFGYEAPLDVKVMCVDAMQFFKGSIPDNIATMDHLYTYFTNLFLRLLDTCEVVVICVDKSSPEIKQLVTHVSRYERRCNDCKKACAIDLPPGQTCGAEYFAKDCKKDCINNQILHHSEGPHLPEDIRAPLPFKNRDWMRFASDSLNLRHELYPRIVNRLLSKTIPYGKVLFLNGFPFKIREVKEWLPEFENGIPIHNSRGVFQNRFVVDYWNAEELPLKSEDYDNGHTIRLEGSNKTLFPDAHNTIHEADHAIFYYLSFFPQYYKQMVFINDGDAISIGLTLAYEYMYAKQQDQHELWLCLPTKEEGQRYEYVNLSLLCALIDKAPEFVKAGVQSPVMTYIFLITLTGTDFFDKICHGIGFKTDWKLEEDKKAKQTPGVMDTFMDKINMFSHLVQFYVGEHSVKRSKRIVIDEELFIIFLQYCYMGKYGEAAKKKHKKDEITFDIIQAHCSKLKDPNNKPPSDDVMLRMCRQIDWNINYILNGWRNIYIDPFEQYEGKSYYGYAKEPVQTIVNVVASKQKPVDETCKRNFWKRKEKQETIVDIPEKRKRSALDKIKGLY